MRNWEEYEGRFASFLEAFPFDMSEELKNLEEQAIADNVPIIRKSTERFLVFLLNVIKPERILELGTAVGFSALLMEENDPSLKELITIEDFESRWTEAEKNFKNLDRAGKIKLLKGDAGEWLTKLDSQQFDLIFIDAAKAQYPDYWKKLKPLVHSGSVVIADNIMQDGHLLNSRFTLNRRDRTIHKRIHEYLFLITHDKDVVSDILTLGDGLALSVFK